MYVCIQKICCLFGWSASRDQMLVASDTKLFTMESHCNALMQQQQLGSQGFKTSQDRMSRAGKKGKNRKCHEVHSELFVNFVSQKQSWV